MHVIGTAGHVDHGKSTLVQRLTGIDPDRFAEEKRRGLTIDLGFAWLPLPSGREIGLIDVPGHERFIKNMLAGAGGINVCLFVVAANEGWMPQSAEHLSIVDILGIPAGVVAITKSDTVAADELELVTAEVEEKVAGSSLSGAPVVACSATTGAGLDDLVAALDRVVESAPPAPDVGRPRLWVDRVFTIAGAGTVVTGTLAGGSFAVGDEVEISLEGRRARIRTLQSHKKEVPEIGPGNRVAMNLAGLERQGAARGDAIVRAKQWRPTARVDVSLRVLPASLSGRDHELVERGAHLLYIGSAETPVRVKLLDRDRLGPGESAVAELYLRDPLPIGRGDRFVLRDAGRVLTFGGGEVLDPLPEPVRRGDRERVSLLERLRGAAAPDALDALLDAYGSMPVAEARLRAGVAEPSDGALVLGDMIASRAFVENLGGRVRATLAEFHRAHPLERGAAREAVRRDLELEPDVFDALIASLDDVVEEGPVLRLASHSVQLAPEQAAARDLVVAAIEAGGFQPPLAKDLDASTDLVRALVDSGELVKIGDFYLTGAQARDARARVRAAIEERGPITVAEIRDLLGTSRKYAVPLCEWLDATGATRRHGDTRALGPTP
ncbi:MAG: selenocysteine-specific translation elongation factor [Actinomycetota bacterium]